MNAHKIVELLGDGISAELSEAVHTVASQLPCQLDFIPVDLSDENRRKRGEPLFDEAEALMREHKVSLKYPTATTSESPNKILRERCQFHVIHRPVCTIPGIETNFTRHLDIDVIRIATGGTYEDVGRRIGPDTAVSLRVIERGPSRHAAYFAFKLALVRGRGVVSTSKYTIQQATDGLFEEVVGEVARDYPSMDYRRELFDALLAGIIMYPERYGVIVCPNEYGDFLSDCACGLIGSVGLGDSASYAFEESGQVKLAMFDPSGGTAPDIAGQNLANPTAALFALANMLRHLGEVEVGAALRNSTLAAIEAGQCTADIGGSLGTREFTAHVCAGLKEACEA
ncbi:MAG: isocitrate/isopropylmalate family dehydrogenase [Planctomycetota bacterium]|jgi:isocitrate dehydrogenase (NAD+)|nr:isocitrate dehydrogenase [Planctomycetota bacterium]MDP6956101.1 isocitrate/isopropylmalate family dehydrogenase [Planctomycetota bacterium]